MEIKLEVNINGLQPLVDALTLLAKGYGASAAAVDQVVSKAKANPAVKVEDSTMGKSAQAAEEQDKPSAKPVDTTTLAAAASEPAGKSADDATEQGSSSLAEPKIAPATQAAADTTSASVTSNSAPITDEALRAAAAGKARINKERTKAIVNKFAESVTLIPADQRAAFLAELETVAA